MIVTSAVVVGLGGLILADAGTLGTEGVPGDIPMGLAVLVVFAMLIGRRLAVLERERDTLRRATVRDPLTGLYSREHILRRVGEETSRSVRYGNEVSLALIGLDDLDSFNATFGRHRGELLVAHMADILGVGVRDTDLLGHYEEGTFLLLLPHCGVASAVHVAERLRTFVREADFEGDELEPITSHTVSVGVCTHPVLAEDAERLFRLAEEGLRRAWREGGDRVEVGSPRRSLDRPAKTDPRHDTQAVGR